MSKENKNVFHFDNKGLGGRGSLVVVAKEDIYVDEDDLAKKVRKSTGLFPVNPFKVPRPGGEKIDID